MTVSTVEVKNGASKERLVLTVEELAKELHIGRNSAYELVCQKDFPAFRVGKKILIPYESLCIWVKCQCSMATEET